MIRDTSILAYQQIEADGSLSRNRFEVYQCLFEHGPLTGSEVNNLLKSKSGHKRLSELQARGVARPVEKRQCNVTGKLAYTWDVTSNLPVEPDKETVEETVEPAPVDPRAEMRAMLHTLLDQLLDQAQITDSIRYDVSADIRPVYGSMFHQHFGRPLCHNEHGQSLTIFLDRSPVRRI